MVYHLRGIHFFCLKIYVGDIEKDEIFRNCNKVINLEGNEEYLVLVRCRIFFDAIGKDGGILAERFGLNPKMNLLKETKAKVVEIILIN